MLIPNGQDATLPLPLGTVKAHDRGTWGLYYNARMNCSWLAYKVPAGTHVTLLGGNHKKTFDVNALRDYVAARQAYACGGCND